MKRKEKVSMMMDQLSKAYGDKDLNDRPDLRAVILKSAQELEKTEDPDLVASKLCKAITMNYFVKRENFPKAIVVLFNQLKGKEMKYDGTALATILLPLWF